AQYDLVVLVDPKHALPPYDAILLTAPKRADDRPLIDALSPLVGAIDVTLMREANLRATGAGASPAAAARWLWGGVEKKKKDGLRAGKPIRSTTRTRWVSARLRGRQPILQSLIPTSIDQRPLLDPRHHAAQLLADLLGRVRGHLGAHRLERGLVDPVL